MTSTITQDDVVRIATGEAPDSEILDFVKQASVEPSERVSAIAHFLLLTDEVIEATQQAGPLAAALAQVFNLADEVRLITVQALRTLGVADEELTEAALVAAGIVDDTSIL